jgi:predicted metal-binding protein
MAEKEKHYEKYYEALVELEGELFKDGYYKAFVFLAGPCRLCKKCAAVENDPCLFPWKARPSMEACGIDAYQTARNNGFFIETLRERTETNNVYCLMMVD